MARKMNQMVAACLLTVGLWNLTAAAMVVKEPGDKKVAEMNNAFALDLYSRLVADDGNLFLSPNSIQTALAMTWAGARGATADQMATTLHLDADAQAGQKLGAFLRALNDDGRKGGYELSVANALWGLTNYPFTPAYLDCVQKTYGGHLAELNFANDPEGSRKIINDWVASQTHDKIKDLMSSGSVTPMTRLVLTNAIYFKGKWDLPFRKEQTQDAEFRAAAGRKITAPFMFQHAKFRYGEDADVQALELPYGHGDLAMRIILPKSADDIHALERGLSAQRLDDLAAKMTQEDVQVWVPRFKVETSYKLEEVLPAMGMKLAFDPNSADFGGMTSASRLFISAVIHKAYVQTDEEGTEAAAATGIGMRSTAVRVLRPPKVFRADHPFVFEIIHQQSGAILFMGRLAAP